MQNENIDNYLSCNANRRYTKIKRSKNTEPFQYIQQYDEHPIGSLLVEMQLHCLGPPTDQVPL